MTLEDVKLLAKKIFVGALVTIVPLLIFLGGLQLTQQILANRAPAGTSVWDAK